MKEKILTKIVRKDYNNNLEEVLKNKDFSEEVKNTILTMFYKIENGYNDYYIVKRETYEKKEYIEKLINIIDKECDKIEFIKNAELQKESVNKENKQIICLPIENRILYSLAKIQKRNVVVKYIDETIEEVFTFLLNIGNNINIVEPLRDFNGFSWNVIIKDIEDVNYNLIYQNVIYLIGNKFVDKWVNNYEPLVDYFDLFKSEIEEKYDKKIMETLKTYVIELALKLKCNYDETFKNKVINIVSELEEENEKISSKEKYLINLSKNKKEKEEKIRGIDKILNDKNLLIQEYEKRNEKLPLEKKIFSIRILTKNLQQERKQILEQIKECNKLMNPKLYIEKKNLLEKKIEYYKNSLQTDLKDILINCQKEMIKCMYIDVRKAEDKNTIIDLIYKYRYYNLLPILNNQYIYETTELKRELNRLTRILIDKAIDMKVINKISTDSETNINIIRKILLSKIIKLTDINLKVLKENEKNYLTIYDEEVEDFKIELTGVDNIKLKQNKKTKLFSV